MVSIRLAIVLLSYLLLIVHSMFAQEVKATARVDSNNISIGDHINLYVEVQRPKNISITWPSIRDSLQGLEIIQDGTLLSKAEEERIFESVKFTLTAFDSGFFSVPPLVFTYKLEDDTTTYSVTTSPIPITVHSVAIDTTQDIKDIKPPLSLAITIEEILPYLIGVIIFSGLIWLVYYIRKKKIKGESLIPEEPLRPAHEIALEALRALEAERLWQRGKIKEYHSQLTDIVRTYIEQRFNVPAMEMVTYEIMNSEKVRELPSEVQSTLNDMLTLADFVKFAKFQPLPHEHEQNLQRAFSFVEATWRQSTEVTPNVHEEVKA